MFHKLTWLNIIGSVLFFLTLLVFISCRNSPEKADKSSERLDVQTKLETKKLTLEESFLAKDEANFLSQFPESFKEFHLLFGWDRTNNKPNKLFHDSKKYIDYWFLLLQNEKHSEYEQNFVEICIDGEWEPEGVDYFRKKSLQYLKENHKYNLINQLDEVEAIPLFSFFFNSPNSDYPEDLASNLNSEKMKLLLKESISWDSDVHEKLVQIDPVSSYINSDAYFIREFDINNDNIPDKIVSHERYQGDELLVFLNSDGSNKLALRSINFSQDGGNQIKDIKSDKNGFIIETEFPDQGFSEADYYILFENEHWILTHTIYKTMSSNEEDAFVYVCNVKQGVDMNDSHLLNKLNDIPDESDREKTCLKEKR